MPGADSHQETWARYFNKHLDASGMRPVDFVERSQQLDPRGKGIKHNQVSTWRSAKHTADSESAVLVARALGLDIAETLRAAGHELLAEELEERLGVRPPEQDPFVLEVTQDPAMPIEEKDRFLREYRAARQRQNQRNEEDEAGFRERWELKRRLASG